MAKKGDLQQWILAALRASGGAGTPVSVARHIWENHEPDLRESGELFYSWQYDLRWEAQKLRHSGVLVPVNGDRRGLWQLADHSLER